MRAKPVERVRREGIKRRPLKASRVPKWKDDYRTFIKHYKVVLDHRTNDICKKALARLLPSTVPRWIRPWSKRLWMPKKASDWVIHSYWTHLPIETNISIRCSLLHLGVRFLDWPPFMEIESTKDLLGLRSLLHLFEKQDLTVIDRGPAIEMLQGVNSDRVGQDASRFVRCLLALLKDHCISVPLSSSHLGFLIDYFLFLLEEPNDPAPSVSLIVDDEHALRFLFEECRAEGGELHELISRLLSTVFTFASDAERVLLVVRHFPQLPETFETMHYDDIFWVMHRSEFAAIAATTPSLVSMVFTRLRHYCVLGEASNDMHNKYAIIATRMMDSVLQVPSQLQHLIGHGYLNAAARHMANTWLDWAEAASFRLILAKHPECKEAFREATSNGPVGNPVADLGRGLRQRWPRPPAWYEFEAEDGVDV